MLLWLFRYNLRYFILFSFSSGRDACTPNCPLSTQHTLFLYRRSHWSFGDDALQIVRSSSGSGDAREKTWLTQRISVAPVYSTLYSTWKCSHYPTYHAPCPQPPKTSKLSIIPCNLQLYAILYRVPCYEVELKFIVLHANTHYLHFQVLQVKYILTISPKLYWI